MGQAAGWSFDPICGKTLQKPFVIILLPPVYQTLNAMIIILKRVSELEFNP